MSKGGALKLGMLVAIVLAAAAAAYELGWLDPHRVTGLATSLHRGRERRDVIALFIIIVAAVTAVGVPLTPLVLAGGAIFGVTAGFVINWVAAVLGACAGYWLARLLGRDAARHFLRKHHSLDHLGSVGHFLPLLRLRALPVVPLFVTNLAAGLAKTDFRIFLAATALGVVPGTAIYTYFAGSLLSRVSGAKQTAMTHVIVAAALLILLTFVPTIARKVGSRR